jgi:hypothetical protein
MRLLDIQLRACEPFGVIFELSEPPVAVEAQDAADAVRRVIVINVLRIRSPANGADASLVASHFVDFRSADAITTLQVVMPIPSLQTLFGLTSPHVVTRLAIRMSAIAHPLVSRELFERLVSTAVGTALHALIVRLGCEINDSRT